jgi:serine/threonine protein kinase
VYLFLVLLFCSCFFVLCVRLRLQIIKEKLSPRFCILSSLSSRFSALRSRFHQHTDFISFTSVCGATLTTVSSVFFFFFVSMRTTQSGALAAAPQPQRTANRPARPLSSSRHPAGLGGGSRSGSHGRSTQFPRTDAPTYKPLRYLGRGSFGVVLLAEDTQSGEKVAIKRVRYDPRLHNREVAILNSVLVDPKTSSKSHVSYTGDENGSGSPATPYVEKENVQDWAGVHHPNIVELRDSYVTYDTSSMGADVATAAAASAFHAQMFHQSGHPMSDFGGTGSVESAYAYLEMVMSYLPMDLAALKKYFYRHRVMPNAELSTLLSSSYPSAATKAEGEAESSDDGRPLPQGHTSTSRPASPRSGTHMPLRWIKIFLFQLARALAFMHAHHVCHRDLKPANVLVDPDTGRLQLCDFGSAKQILSPTQEKNVSYICSRYYRAPELLFGALHYGCEVDMWSFGCLLAELLRESGRPLFRGCTSVDQMAELFKVMGAPSTREMYAMNPQCAEALLRTHAMHKPHSAASTGLRVGEMEDHHASRVHHDGFLEEEEEEEEDVLEAAAHDTTAPTPRHHSLPNCVPASDSTLPCHHHHADGDDVSGADADASLSGEAAMRFDEYYDVLKVRAIPWRTLFPVGTPNDAVALATALLCYAPQKRLSAPEVVEHAFFDDLFSPSYAKEDTADDGGDGEAQTQTGASTVVGDASLRMPNGRLMPLEMFQVTETERGLFTDAFLQKMARQAELISAARKAEEAQGTASSNVGSQAR